VQVLAQDSYCFSKKYDLMDARAALLKVLTVNDEVSLDLAQHCLVVTVDPVKEPVVEAFLQRRVGIFQKKFVKKAECHISVTEISKTNTDSNQVQVGSRTKINQGNQQSENSTQSTLKVLENKWAIIEMNDSRVDIKCLKRGDFFELEVRVGSEGSYLSNSVQLMPGQQVDLGQIVKDINEKNQEVSSSRGINLQKKTGVKENVFKLTIH
tara:strand:+ start:1103 stop:1732 length:630 start_codon:yes stop_codon:yes gene_type:complete